MDPLTWTVLVRSVRTTGADATVTAALAAGAAGRPLSTTPATRPAATTGTATIAARRSRRPPARSAITVQTRQRGRPDLRVEQRPAGAGGMLEDRARLAAGRDLAHGEAESVTGRVGRLGVRVLDVRQAVRAQALGRPDAGLDQLRRRRRLGVRAQAGP